MLTDLSQRPRVRLFTIILILALFNFFVHPLLVGTGGYGSGGGINYSDAFSSSVSSFIFGLPILGFVIGFGIAAFKKRKVSYKEDGIDITLKAIIVINTLFALGHINIIGRILLS
jgi:hypothetical protein